MPTWIPYCGKAPVADEWSTHWNLTPELLVALFIMVVASSIYRDRLSMRPTAIAIALVAFLYVSPFCVLGSALFTVRIIHDVVLAAVLAPLLVAALGLHRLEIVGTPGHWTAIHVLTFWLWHAPSFYAAATSSDLVFWLMQITITGTAALWWAKILCSPAPAAVTSLLASMVAMGTLGALLTFAGRALYAPHLLTTQSFGLSPIEDQQIAGIVMWAPASLVYLLAALTILYRSMDARQIA